MKAWAKVGIGLLAAIGGIVVLFFGLLIILAILTPQIQPDTQKSSKQTTASVPDPITRDALASLLNEERLKAGLPALTVDPSLNESAQAKADDMLANNYYAHTNPTTGKHGYSYISDMARGKCLTSSENIAAGDMTAESAVKGWMESESHRNAILDPRYTMTGIGITSKNNDPASGRQDYYYLVQHFCEYASGKCMDVTSYDDNWSNDVICNRPDGTQFYTSYAGADAFLAQ